jgi:hypothetical protein
MDQPILKHSDNRPGVVKDLMTKLDCDPLWYTNRYPGRNNPNWFVIHPRPDSTLAKDKQVKRSWGKTREWGQSPLPIRYSVGAIDYHSQTEHYRFGTPWSPGHQSFRKFLDKLEKGLVAIKIAIGDTRPKNQWYRHKDEVGDRLWYETESKSEIVKEYNKYVEILSNL